MSQVTIIGTAGHDGELRFTRTGVPVLTFSIASNRRVKDGDEWKDGPTSWRRVTVWRGLAEALAAEVTKGRRLIVVGEEEVREYDREDGSKGVSVEVTADHVGVYVFPRRAGERPQEPVSGDGDASGYGDAFDAQFGAETPF